MSRGEPHGRLRARDFEHRDWHKEIVQLHMTAALIHALPASDRRVYNRNEAASYVGVSPGHFRSLVAEGTLPPPLPLPGVRRWDKAALDRALDRLSGVPSEQASAYDAWRSTRGQG